MPDKSGVKMKKLVHLSHFLLLVLVQISYSQLRQGSGTILVKISSILNPEGRDAAGSCCSEGTPSAKGVCPGPCYSMLRVCSTNVKNESMLVIHGGGPRREYGLDRTRQQEDPKPIPQKEAGIRGRNPSQKYQVNFAEQSTRKSVPPGNSRSKVKPNNQFSEKSRIPPKLSPPTDFKSPIRIAPNLLPPNKNIGRRPYIKPPKNRPKKRKPRPPTKLYTNFALPPNQEGGYTYQPNSRESAQQPRPFRHNQPLPQSRTGLPFFENRRKENQVWETNEYTVMWREERMLLKPSTECKFGSLKTEVVFNNSLENQGDLLVRLPFYEGWSGVFELTIEVWHVKNPKKIPQPVLQSKKVEEKSIFASILETLTTQLTKTVNDIELKKSESEKKPKEDQVNLNATKLESRDKNRTKDGIETSTSIIKETTQSMTDDLELVTKAEIGNKTIEAVKYIKDKDINKSDIKEEEDDDKNAQKEIEAEAEEEEEDTGQWKVMTNKAKLILRLERDHMIYAGEDWQSSYFKSYHSRIDYSIKLGCAKNFTGPTCSFAKICLSKNIKLHKRLTCTEDGQIICRPGWKGALCDQAICASGCHSANGYCKTPGECRCKSGYFGSNCESCVKLLGCSSHGYCSKSYECLCEEGYKGIFCSEPICKESCDPNNGFCSQPGQCKCKTGWKGENCTECIIKPGCKNGTCSKPYECNCEEGFKGGFCDRPDCGHGCHETNGFCEKPGECFCKVGFQGKRCDECLPYPGCLNGGCEIPWDCQCLDGWKGLKCDQMETEAFGNGIRLGRCLPVGDFLCMNGGIDICSWHGNGTMLEEPRCQCRGGFTGKYCQESLAGDSGGVYRTLAVAADDNEAVFQFPSKLDNSLEKLK